MTNPTPPDSYWERPDARPDEVYEEATWQADLLCAEWAAWPSWSCSST
jgi:hypothetical protein